MKLLSILIFIVFAFGCASSKVERESALVDNVSGMMPILVEGKPPVELVVTEDGKPAYPFEVEDVSPRIRMQIKVKYRNLEFVPFSEWKKFSIT